MKHKIEVEIKLLGGGILGTLAVITDKELSEMLDEDKQLMVKSVIQDSIFSCMKNIFTRGAYEISREHKLTKK